MTMQLAERKKLIGFIAEIEASRDRAKGETRHQSEVFKKAKESGFDNKAMRKVLQRRAMSDADRDKMDEAINDYEHALGALALAKEAVSSGMSAREAAERYHVPRGALGILTGARNAISEPDADPDTGEVISPPVEMVVEEGISVLSGRDETSDEISSAASHGRVDDASVSPPADVVPPTANPQMEGVAPPSVTPAPSAGIEAGTIHEAATEESAGEAAGNAGGSHDAGLTTLGQEVARAAPPEPISDDPGPMPAFLRRERVSA